MDRTPDGALELWGGAECTVNRIGDVYRDQTRISGHQDRPEDLDRFAALGIRALRYPVLWERVAPDRADQREWTWSDERIARMRTLGIVPIVGLLHHGSGPRYTSLVDPAFPALLGEYAGAVAARYPHVVDWTPVNEPLTTARFSALYGHWYPHACDDRSFWGALLNQIDGTRMAMRAICAVNSTARLVQTEDLGHTQATSTAAHVAEHYNQRRWMTWDLLAGRVDRTHPLWAELDMLGYGDRLRALVDDPCPADLLGVNHYVTSDRFLDGRARAHRGALPTVGYHDLTAVRALLSPPPGLAGALREAWDRYHTPLAVTESHLGCTREEQLRWIAQGWQACLALRGEGVDVRALTAWALLGSFDWDSLLTRDTGHYEPGAFDVRGAAPRPTAIAGLLAALGTGAALPANVAAVIAGDGWWQRDIRLEHMPHMSGASPDRREAPAWRRPLLIAGATGTLGQALVRTCAQREIPHVLTTREMLPLDDAEGIAAALDRYRPWAVINAAGWVRVDEAEDHAADCLAANGQGAGMLARACATRGIHCTLISSDLVFDGAHAPYDEASRPTPLGVYGRSKAVAESEAAAAGGAALVIRTAAFFSPHDPHNFAAAVERTLRAGEPFRASPDHVVTPTYVPDLVQACLDLVVDGATGVWHLTSGEALSWFGFAQRIADVLKLDRGLIVAAGPEELGWRAPRPHDATLLSTKGRMLPTLDDALARHAAVCRQEAERGAQAEREAERTDQRTAA